MAKKPRPEGVCRICGTYGPLTYEHIPPHKAFNNRPVIEVPYDESIRLGPDDVPKGRPNQRGAGAYTLCDRCNNNTGAWYGEDFVDWCYQAMGLLIRSGGNPTRQFPYIIRPLRIIKQITAMFFSLQSQQFHTVQPDLVKFVLDRETRVLPPPWRVFLYYNIEGRPRYAGSQGSLQVIGQTQIRVMTEITYPPFGYLMTQQPPPDGRLVDISHFGGYDYDDSTLISLRLPSLPTWMPFAGDYRTREEIYRDASGVPPDKIVAGRDGGTIASW